MVDGPRNAREAITQQLTEDIRDEAERATDFISILSYEQVGKVNVELRTIRDDLYTLNNDIENQDVAW